MFKKLEKIWRIKKVSVNTKLGLFKATVILTASNTADTWKSTVKPNRNLDFLAEKP